MKKIVLVTGAASGLGNVIAEYFASQDFQVILSASTLQKAQDAQAKSQYAHNIVPAKLDIAIVSDFEEIIEWIEDKYCISFYTYVSLTPFFSLLAHLGYSSILTSILRWPPRWT